VIDRFSARRMADGYEAVYAQALGLDTSASAEDEPAQRHTAVEPEAALPAR